MAMVPGLCTGVESTAQVTEPLALGLHLGRRRSHHVSPAFIDQRLSEPKTSLRSGPQDHGGVGQHDPWEGEGAL